MIMISCQSSVMVARLARNHQQRYQYVRIWRSCVVFLYRIQQSDIINYRQISLIFTVRIVTFLNLLHLNLVLILLSQISMFQKLFGNQYFYYVQQFTLYPQRYHFLTGLLIALKRYQLRQ